MEYGRFHWDPMYHQFTFRNVPPRIQHHLSVFSEHFVHVGQAGVVDEHRLGVDGVAPRPAVRAAVAQPVSVVGRRQDQSAGERSHCPTHHSFQQDGPPGGPGGHVRVEAVVSGQLQPQDVAGVGQAHAGHLFLWDCVLIVCAK